MLFCEVKYRTYEKKALLIQRGGGWYFSGLHSHGDVWNGVCCSFAWLGCWKTCQKVKISIFVNHKYLRNQLLLDTGFMAVKGVSQREVAPGKGPGKPEHQTLSCKGNVQIYATWTIQQKTIKQSMVGLDAPQSQHILTSLWLNMCKCFENKWNCFVATFYPIRGKFLCVGPLSEPLNEKGTAFRLICLCDKLQKSHLQVGGETQHGP